MILRRLPRAGDASWTFGCGLSAVVALPFHLLARLPPLAGRVWPVPVLVALSVTVSVAGPVAMVLYDVATEGTPGDCVLPWWPSWLPS
ncbi:hypothetical protein HCN51_20145 [Nonomuraea sp. FMUSA5-5]|uniref:Integral membrane protein n=1 Tax=Nonomuraea composti TaxID=2720023 RepID=A0ABX1B4K2_9ACTN|nr:hypothetical protein [Nonomuraea sp. FMUSA5-5]NJP91742.1 hypothetical protein [Nonomuraea sp. FMUSA5-5]